jgi:hypothetical protein
MATQEEWYKKLRSWVPAWFFEEEDVNVAKFQAMAALLASIEARAVEHQQETFIAQADQGYLDEHGLERNLTRGTLELDVAFSQRIRYITNSTSKPAIKRLVDALLSVGVCEISEDFEAGVYCDREDFFSRGELFIDAIYNVFSIIVDKQVHTPYSFYDREYFCDREDFIGTQESSLELFQLIIEAVDKAKALGTLYRLIERTG